MSLKITGSVIEILEEQSGTGKNGAWRKQDFILETEGEYANPICITQWGDNIEKFNIEPGQKLTAHIDLRSREYNGRWYTDVKAWKVERDAAVEGPAAAGASGSAQGPGAPGGESPPLADEEMVSDDDLPF